MYLDFMDTLYIQEEFILLKIHFSKKYNQALRRKKQFRVWLFSSIFSFFIQSHKTIIVFSPKRWCSRRQDRIILFHKINFMNLQTFR